MRNRHATTGWSADCAGSGVKHFANLLMTQARGAWRTTWSTVRRFVDDEGLSWAGAIGLYLFLSVPPFMVAAASVAAAFFPPEDAEAFVIEQVTKYLPAEEELMQGIMSARPEEPIAGAVAVVLLLFSGSRAFAALTSAVNVMWRRVDELTFLRRQVLRIGMLLLTLGMLALAALTEAVVSLLFDTDDASQEIWLLDWQLIPALLLGAFLLVSYKLLPRQPVSWTHAALGAAVATIGVRVAQAGLGSLSDAGTFRVPYGDLADVALMATWALVVGAIILFGAALVAVLDGRRTIEGDDDPSGAAAPAPRA